MLFDTTGLDIVIGQITLNFFVSASFLIRSRYNNNNFKNLEKIVQKKNQKQQSEVVCQTKISNQNQNSSIKKNTSAQKSFKPNEFENTKTKKIIAEPYPQSSGLLISPSHKIIENDKLMSDTNRQTQRSSLVPILQTQKQQTSSKSGTIIQNANQQNTKQQSDQNKSIINQLKENPSFAVSKLVQCQQCKADNSVEQSDDIITIERKRNMSIPSELKDDENFQNQKDKQKQEEQHQQCLYKQQEQAQYVQIQNHFLLISCIFYVQSIIQKLNSSNQIYEEININNILEITLLQALAAALFYNVFYAVIITFMEKILKCHQVITRLLFFAHNVSIPFYVYSTIQEQNRYINLEFLLMIGCIYFIQFIVFIFCAIINWKSYPLNLFIKF